jgi:hypothetical protein
LLLNCQNPMIRYCDFLSIITSSRLRIRQFICLF